MISFLAIIFQLLAQPTNETESVKLDWTGRKRIYFFRVLYDTIKADYIFEWIIQWYIIYTNFIDYYFWIKDLWYNYSLFADAHKAESCIGLGKSILPEPDRTRC